MLHRVILTAASVFALTTAANAADMYRPAEGGYKDVPYVGVNWSGLYAGVNGGYAALMQQSASKTIGAPFNGSAPSGAFGGGQVGYNFQGAAIPCSACIEADIQGGRHYRQQDRVGRYLTERLRLRSKARLVWYRSRAPWLHV